jgi:hypothetical protein
LSLVIMGKCFAATDFFLCPPTPSLSGYCVAQTIAIAPYRFRNVSKLDASSKSE